PTCPIGVSASAALLLFGRRLCAARAYQHTEQKSEARARSDNPLQRINLQGLGHQSADQNQRSYGDTSHGGNNSRPNFPKASYSPEGRPFSFSRRADGRDTPRGTPGEAFAVGAWLVVVAGPNEHDVAWVRVLNTVRHVGIRASEELAAAGAVRKGAAA